MQWKFYCDWIFYFSGQFVIFKSLIPGDITKKFWEKAIQFHGPFHGLKITNCGGGFSFFWFNANKAKIVEN